MAMAEHACTSLEGMVDFGAEHPPLTKGERESAQAVFYAITSHCAEKEDQAAATATPRAQRSPYKRATLVKLTHDYAYPDESKDVFLRALFGAMDLPLVGATIDWDDEDQEQLLQTRLFAFAKYLMDHFYMPVKASSGKTPQPSPLTRQAIERAQGAPPVTLGTPERLSTLRETCLVRDQHRCVVSGGFDFNEARVRFKAMGDNATDDCGKPFSPPCLANLEVAHIVPHSLVQVDSKLGAVSETKKAALAILDLFDNGVAHILQGTDIDQPHNAICLTHELRSQFGDFDIFFSPVPGSPHTYRIETFLPQLLQMHPLPVTRTLLTAPDNSVVIDMPLPRLLAIHRAIAHILHLSAAGDYIDSILRDAEQVGVRSDGSTPLGSLVNIGLAGGLPARAGY